ncbi:unnamed protein product [Leuciscus chuanchicus]
MHLASARETPMEQHLGYPWWEACGEAEHVPPYQKAQRPEETVAYGVVAHLHCSGGSHGSEAYPVFRGPLRQAGRDWGLWDLVVDLHRGKMCLLLLLCGQSAWKRRGTAGLRHTLGRGHTMQQRKEEQEAARWNLATEIRLHQKLF